MIPLPKIYGIIVFLVLTTGSAFAQTVKQKDKLEPVNVIFDTDMGPDFDDIGAISMLHALAANGECTILATVSSNAHPTIAATIETYNRYFQKPDIPVGAAASTAPNFTAANGWNDSIIAFYAPALLKKKYPSALTVYRQVLAAQSDNSVTLITVGFMSNIRDLLNSPADESSPLNGLELVRRKVKNWVAMAGAFPVGIEFNVKEDAAAARQAFADFPKPILFSGFAIGEHVQTGDRVASRQDNDPVSYGYRFNFRTYAPQRTTTRASWDQTTVLAAVRNPTTYFYVNGPGKLQINEDGSNIWVHNEAAQQQFLTSKLAHSDLANIIEELMLYQPKVKP